MENGIQVGVRPLSQQHLSDQQHFNYSVHDLVQLVVLPEH